MSVCDTSFIYSTCSALCVVRYATYVKRDPHECQKRPTYMSKETHIYVKKDPFVCLTCSVLAEPDTKMWIFIYMSKETHIYVKRDPRICQKRPAYMSKEICQKRGGNLGRRICVAVCRSVLQCVAVWCSVVQCGAVWCSVLQYMHCVAVCCSVLRCVAVCCGVLQFVILGRCGREFR